MKRINLFRRRPVEAATYHRHSMDRTLIEVNPHNDPNWWRWARVMDVCHCGAYQVVNPGGHRDPWRRGPLPPNFEDHLADRRA